MSLLSPLGNNVWHFQLGPQDEIRKKNPHRPGPATRNQESCPQENHQDAGGVRHDCPCWEPRGNWLPHEHKVAVDERERAKPKQTNCRQRQCWLLFVTHNQDMHPR